MLEKISTNLGLFNKIKHWIIYKILRAKVQRQHKELDRSMVFYPESRAAFEITKIQCRMVTSEVEYAPVSHEFYISNGEKHIIIKQNSVTIINDGHPYYSDMPTECIKYLDKHIKRILERRRSKKKKKIESTIIRSLTDILENLQIEEKIKN